MIGTARGGGPATRWLRRPDYGRTSTASRRGTAADGGRAHLDHAAGATADVAAAASWLHVRHAAAAIAPGRHHGADHAGESGRSRAGIDSHDRLVTAHPGGSFEVLGRHRKKKMPSSNFTLPALRFLPRPGHEAARTWPRWSSRHASGRCSTPAAAPQASHRDEVLNSSPWSPTLHPRQCGGRSHRRRRRADP